MPAGDSTTGLCFYVESCFQLSGPKPGQVQSSREWERERETETDPFCQVVRSVGVGRVWTCEYIAYMNMESLTYCIEKVPRIFQRHGTGQRCELQIQSCSVPPLRCRGVAFRGFSLELRSADNDQNTHIRAHTLAYIYSTAHLRVVRLLPRLAIYAAH
jgi:hypothetical protein